MNLESKNLFLYQLGMNFELIWNLFWVYFEQYSNLLVMNFNFILELVQNSWNQNDLELIRNQNDLKLIKNKVE